MRGDTRGNSTLLESLLDSISNTGTSFVYFLCMSIDTSSLSISTTDSTTGGVKLIRLMLDNFFSSASHKQHPLRENRINTAEFIFQEQDHTHKA